VRRARGRRQTAAPWLGALVATVFAVAGLVGGCGDDGGAATTSTVVVADCVARQPVLRVDLVGQAVELVETDMGGPQQYFEINATELLVNVFVAVDNGTKVQPFVFLAGELNSSDLQPAQGNTFVASALDFDPQKVTSCVADELPESSATAFEIIGGDDGAISYSLIVDSPNGGQLVVAVAGDGRVLSVDPV
jgi:hypothetical protein